MSMCPSCGMTWPNLIGHLIPSHRLPDDSRIECAGSMQGARNSESDRRPLWNGQPNPHLPANKEK